MNDSELTARLARLPRRLDPPADLWPGIEAGIAAPARSARPHRWQPLAVAAAMALAIGVTLWTNTGTAPDTLLADEAPGLTIGEGRAYANSVELMYSGALRTLAGEFPQPAGALETGELELSLRTIQHATEEIRAALAVDPDSIYLAGLLESTHRKRVQMLRAVALAGVESEDGRRI